MAYTDTMEAERVSQAHAKRKARQQKRIDPQQQKRMDPQAFSSMLSEASTACSDGSTLCSDGLEDEVVHWSSLHDICQSHAPPVAPSWTELMSAKPCPMNGLSSQPQAERARPLMQEIPQQAERHTEPHVQKGEYAKPTKVLSTPLPVGLVQADPAYSRGSKNHALGMCRPCRSFNSPEGCSKGVSCNFCHCPHDESSLQEVEQSLVKGAERRLRQEVLRQMNEQSSCFSCATKADSRHSSSFVLDEPWYVPMPASLPRI